MLFSEVMRSMQHDGDGWSASAGEEWTTGRTLFGGLQGALLARAMRACVPADLPLRTLQATFLAPVPPGSVRVRAQVLRTGKNAQHVEARLLDGDQTLCLAIGVFGAARASAVSVMPQRPALEVPQPRPLRFVPGITPAFTQHFSTRWLRGHPPASGVAETEQVIDMELHDSGPVEESQVLAFADVIAPIAMSWLPKPVSGGTLTWMIEFPNAPRADWPLRGWRFDATLAAARDGYTSQGGVLWAPDGTAAALSRQSMVVFG